jgi:hypothetical protein
LPLLYSGEWKAIVFRKYWKYTHEYRAERTQAWPWQAG